MQAYFVRREPAGAVGDLVVAPWEAVIVPLEDADGRAPALACAVESNPLRAPGGGLRWPTPIEDVNCPPTIIAWSGTVADGFFDRDPRSWGPDARHRFEIVCSRVHERLVRARRRIAFRPCSRHVLSDAPSALAFLRARESQPFGIVLDAVALLEPEMFARGGEQAMDHATRSFEALGGLCDAVWLTGGVVDDRAGRVVPAALAESRVPAPLLATLLRNCCPPETPLILAGPRPAEDLAALRAAGAAVGRSAQ